MDRNNEKSILSTIIGVRNELCQKLRSGEFHPDSDIEDFPKFIIEHGQLHRVPEQPKCNAKAAKLRNAGNRLYLEKKFDEALARYNESICFAEPDSDQLGMGFANRSAVYIEQGEYEFALFNVDLAKKHNYPEKLMPKLLTRQRNCQQQIGLGNSKAIVPRLRMNINVDINPKIPFLAKGIRMGYDSKFGRGLFAEKDFKPGNVILDEKLELCGLEFDLSYTNCNQCSSAFSYSLIPCPTCPLFMYCNEECRKLNWDLYHRFECGVATKLCSVSCISTMIMPRLFFYGLSQFKDNLQEMIDYCELEINTEFNPLEADYTTPNRMEVFKALHNTTSEIDERLDSNAKLAASSYYVVFLKNPLVRSIIRSEHHRQFFLQFLLTYSRVASTHSINAISQDSVFSTMSPVTSIFNHSCDPNAARFVHHGRAKIFVLQPIRKGEQIFTSYGPTWWEPVPDFPLSFKCQCIVCDRGAAGRKWRFLKERNLPQKAGKNLQVMKDILNSAGISYAAKANSVQQFIVRHAHFHPQQDLGNVLNLYDRFLITAIETEDAALIRAELQTTFADL